MSEFMNIILSNGMKAFVRNDAVSALTEDVLPDGRNVTRLFLNGHNIGFVTDTPISKLIDQLSPHPKKAPKKSGG